MSRSIRPAGWLSALAAVLIFGGASVARADGAAPKEETPPHGLRLSVTPSLDGPWKMVVSNDGDKPMRVLADGRLVTLEIIGAPEPPPDPDAKDAHGKPRKKKPAPKPQGFPRGKIPTCKMPPEMRPPAGSSERALVLQPGDSYEESFDPVAYCGANAVSGQLGVGAVVYASMGWPVLHKPKKKKKDAATEIPDPPYLAESLKDPRDAPPVRLLEAPPAIVMAIPPEPVAPPDDAKPDDTTKTDAKPDDAKTDPKKTDPKPDDTKVDASKPAAPKPDDNRSSKHDEHRPDVDPVDERAPRVEVTTHPRGDAEAAGDVALTVTMKNVGKRAALLHLRTDDIAFRVVTPTGRQFDCNKEAEARAAVRDFFETLGEGHTKSMLIRLREVCPTGTFHRPGVYTIKPRLVLHDSGTEYRLTALVATSEAKQGAKIRVRTGPLPYHPTKAVVAKKAPPPETVDDET